MFGTTIAKNSIASIRSKKLNLNSNVKVNGRIKALQKEMVRLSFEPNNKARIDKIAEEIRRLRLALKMAR